MVQMHIFQLTNDNPGIILNNEDRVIKQYRVTGDRNNRKREQPDSRVIRQQSNQTTEWRDTRVTDQQGI